MTQGRALPTVLLLATGLRSEEHSQVGGLDPEGLEEARQAGGTHRCSGAATWACLSTRPEEVDGQAAEDDGDDAHSTGVFQRRRRRSGRGRPG